MSLSPPGDPRIKRAYDQVKLANAHTEAREHALREVVSWAKGILNDLDDGNVGLAKMKARHLISHASDEHGTPQMVVDAINLMGDRFPS